MTILFFDFASHRQQFALVRDGAMLQNAVLADHKAEEDLMPTLQKLLIDQSMKLEDISAIACVTGPGGFTSIRVGVSFANALGFGLKIPVAGMHLADLWSTAAKKEALDFIWLHSTRKTAVFVQGFGSFTKKWPEPTLIDINALKAELKEAEFVGELIPEHQEFFGSALKKMKTDSFDAVLPELLQTLHYQQETPLLPWYGREA